MELHNAADSSLTSDSDSGPNGDAFISHYTITSSGTYYVKVGKYYYATSPGNYEVHVDLARGLQQETDAGYSNNSISGANALSLSAAGTHQTATVAGTIMAPEGSHRGRGLLRARGLERGQPGGAEPAGCRPPAP